MAPAATTCIREPSSLSCSTLFSDMHLPAQREGTRTRNRCRIETGEPRKKERSKLGHRQSNSPQCRSLFDRVSLFNSTWIHFCFLLQGRSDERSRTTYVCHLAQSTPCTRDTMPCPPVADKHRTAAKLRRDALWTGGRIPRSDQGPVPVKSQKPAPRVVS